MDRPTQLRLLPGNVARPQPTYAAVEEISAHLAAYERAMYAFDFDKAVRHIQAVMFCSLHQLDVANQRKQVFAAVRVVKER